MKLRSKLTLAIGLVGVALLVFILRSPTTESGSGSGAALVSVIVPELSASEKIGEVAYNANCASCHGANGAGQDGVAPPFVHRVYEPNHHGDGAFFVAVQNGVRAHHWSFGDMPPVQGVSRAEVGQIITYIRTLQRANGI